MTYFFGIDPGEHIGFVAGTPQGEKLVLDTVSIPFWNDEQLYGWMKDYIRDSSTDGGDFIIVCEDYIIDPRPKDRGGSGYNHQWDRGITLRQIGALRLLCEMKYWKLVLQPNFRKPAGYGYMGKKYVKGAKGQHTLDALAHLMFYGVEHKLWAPTIQEMAPERPVPKADSRPKRRVVSVPVWRKPRTP